MSTFLRLCRASALACLVCILVHSAALAQDETAAIGLSPVRYDPARPATRSYFVYQGNLGQVVSDEVRVRNNGKASGRVRLYPVDSMTSDTGGSAFRQRNDARQGAGSWMSIAETEFTLAPGEERIVPFSVTIPADARGGQHLGGLVAEEASPRADSGNGQFRVSTSHRTIIAVQIDLPGTRIERVNVTGVRAAGSVGVQQLVLGLQNDGTEMVKPTGTLAITDAQGREVQRLALKLDTFLPGSAIQYPVAIQRQALGAGQYRAKVDLTYGVNGTTSYEGEFGVTPAHIAQVFPSTAPLAPPQAAPNSPAAIAASPAQWPIIVGGGVLLLVALLGGLFLGRRARPVRNEQ